MVTARPRIAVVVPVYGNELSLVELYERIAQACEAAHVELTLQFVNDRSPDDSQTVLAALAERAPRVCPAGAARIARRLGQPGESSPAAKAMSVPLRPRPT